MDPIQKVLPALHGVRPAGTGKWSARCPAHDDRHQSLGVGAFSDGGVWLKCHAGCPQEAILAALRVSRSDLQPPSNGAVRPAVHQRPLPAVPTFEAAIARALRTRPGSRHAGTWCYADAAGREVVRVIRIDHPAPPGGDGVKPSKTFRPVRKTKEGWLLQDPPGPLPLYNLTKLAGAARVYITEGEKAADAAVKLGLVATTSIHGSQAPHKSDWTPLKGKELVILPDHDEAGEKYASLVQECVAGLSPPPVVRVLRLPDLQDKDDICEFVERRAAAGKSPEAIRAEIESLAAVAPISGGQDFTEPQPIPDNLLPVQPFDPGLLPEKLRRSVIDGAERISCPVDYVAISAVIGLAGVVGRKVALCPKRHDTWKVVPNLWGAVVGRPGTMKTSGVKEGLQYLLHRDAVAKKAHDKELKKQKAAEMVQKAKQQKIGQEIREALESSEEAALARATEALDDDEPPPVRRRYIVNDTTVEKLGEILNQNPDGVLVYRDELTGFLMGLEKDGQEQSRAFYLEAWDGTSPYTFDRIGRGTLEIASTCVSIIGGIQPGPLAQHLRSVARGGAGDDGLLQRFQLLVWPDQKAEWKNVDRPPDPEARAEMIQTYEALAQAEHLSLGAEHDPQDAAGIPFLRFSDDAQVRFDEWRAYLEGRLRSGTEDLTFESHLAKYRSLVPSLALLFHLVEGRRGPVGLDVLERAIRWVPYLESHARRLYAYSMNRARIGAEALAKKLIKGEVEDGFTARSIYRRGWSSLNEAEVVDEACEFLADLGWLVARRISTGGRGTVVYSINPRLACPDVAHSLGFPNRGS